MTDTDDNRRARGPLTGSLADDTLNRWLGHAEADAVDIPDEPATPRPDRRPDRLPAPRRPGSRFIARSTSPGASPQASWLESLFGALAWLPLLCALAFSLYLIHRGLQVFGFL